MPEDVHEATDIADEGLDLVRQWEKKGVARFRAIAYDLFRFGTVVYATYQPQFLNEFVREHLDPSRSSAEYVGSAEMRAAVQEALERWGPRKDCLRRKLDLRPAAHEVVVHGGELNDRRMVGHVGAETLDRRVEVEQHASARRRRAPCSESRRTTRGARRASPAARGAGCSTGRAPCVRPAA